MRKLTLLLLCVAMLCTVQTFAQNSYTGLVKDASGIPIANASVKIKKQRSGTSAADDGSFKISAPEGSVLQISAVGFETKELSLGSELSIMVELVADLKALGEVVVTGVGVATSKKKLGISVESITADKLPQAPSASIDQALVGKIPGAQISSTTGNPGEPTNILLRGINTVQGGTRPLIMIDGVGVPSTDISALDLSSVERVEIVQGAASSTIYGAQGANGVIQIFTKKGKKGNIAINLSSSYATNEFVNEGDVHKAKFHPYLTDANNNILNVVTGQPAKVQDWGGITGLSYTYGGAARYGILNIQNQNNKPFNANLPYFDHYKQVFQTGYTTNNNINISGATDKTDFSVSLSNNHTLTSILKSGSVDRSNIVANLGTKLFKGFTFRSTTQVIYTKNSLLPGLGAGRVDGFHGNGSSVYAFNNTSQFFDLSQRMPDGHYPQFQGAEFLSVNAGNPYYRTEYTREKNNKIDVIQSFNANYVVNRFVELDAKYGINYQTQDIRETYLNQEDNLNVQHYDTWIQPYNPLPEGSGSILSYDYNTTSQNFIGSAFFRTDFEKDFNINFPLQTSTQVAYDYRKRAYRELDNYAYKLQQAPPINFTSTEEQGTFYDYTETFITYGYLINQKLEFGNYGGVTGGFRSDYSSAFGQGSKPFTFPHFDAHITPLSFIPNANINDLLPYLKFRAAYGQAGIQPSPHDRYPYLDPGNLAGVVYSVPGTLLDKDVQVEVSTEKEVGLDLTLNLNRKSNWFKSIDFSATYWARKSSDVIYNLSNPPSSGSTAFKTNAMDLKSDGYQLSLNIPIYSGRDFDWNLTTNYGHQVSKITRITGGNDIILASSAGDAALVLTAGQKIGQIFGYKALRSVEETRTDGSRYIDKADEGLYTIVEGRVVKKSDYQMQFSDEKTPFGDPNPKFNMSFINSMNWKGISFGWQFDWVYGTHLYNQSKEWMYRDGIHGDFEKPVTIDGNTGAFTAYHASAYYNLFGSQFGAGNNATKDYFYEGASFLRLRNISLAYDFANLLKVPVFKKVQLIFTGRNIFTVTDYTGFDPEINSGAINSAFDRGVDHNTLPNVKSYQVGLNLGF